MMQATLNFFAAAWKVYKAYSWTSSCVFERHAITRISYIYTNNDMAIVVVAKSPCLNC
jgi:hypothetical protein